ncbi:protein muscleblind-like isoform X7 [Macrosteles quadrilineatus]|uniref:protein muscleblind-like isoform X7 n=1 Tax=Macrosteles quadrilineatus TaxID=74068 RepID=UPI0023E1ED98|nr:protein muscleblind-like isoform X7 [Macrosteles quadrilineatus]XP_054284559.1 protein muscleblind-like isoform X7 [Macrosteles quadrilineatus]
MAMVNMNNLLNGKDSRWLQLEVCREFQRNKCSRPDTECKFAHPPANVEVQNGRVTACYDSIKGRCNRDKPPCKYFHPPQHLKDQLLINGRNHLALKNALMQQMGLTPGQSLVPGQVPTVVGGKFQIPTPALTFGQPQLGLMATNPYLGMPQVGSTFSPYFSPPIIPAMMGPDPATQLGMVQQTVVTQQKMPRSDRLEMDMKSVGSFYYENFAFPGMVPYKRAAGDKSGVPVYQPSATYQQLLQPFVPVSFTGHPPGVPRF